jgi:uncharacterized ubiquitin-like protein YukD
MSALRVTLVDSLSDKTFDVELPDDAPMNQLVPQLLPKLGLNPQGSFTLQLKRTEKILGPTETLRSAGVQAGDALRIVQAPTAAQ